jgi:hypothetical protein
VFILTHQREIFRGEPRHVRIDLGSIPGLTLKLLTSSFWVDLTSFHERVNLEVSLPSTKIAYS